MGPSSSLREGGALFLSSPSGSESQRVRLRFQNVLAAVIVFQLVIEKEIYADIHTIRDVLGPKASTFVPLGKC